MPAWINASYRVAFTDMLLLDIANIVIFFEKTKGEGAFFIFPQKFPLLSFQKQTGGRPSDRTGYECEHEVAQP